MKIIAWNVYQISDWQQIYQEGHRIKYEDHCEWDKYRPQKHDFELRNMIETLLPDFCGNYPIFLKYRPIYGGRGSFIYTTDFVQTVDSACILTHFRINSERLLFMPEFGYLQMSDSLYVGESLRDMHSTHKEIIAAGYDPYDYNTLSESWKQVYEASWRNNLFKQPGEKGLFMETTWALLAELRPEDVVFAHELTSSGITVPYLDPEDHNVSEDT